jgi:CRISPR/Cas system CSM-associated protein Csm3 (group 7 of RAMP superfamily)
MMTTQQDRWIIKGSFVTCSPLSIRTGTEEIPAEKSAVAWQARVGEANTPPLADDKIAPIQAIETDCDGMPFIPATAIKGLLRSLAARRTGKTGLVGKIKALFGNMPHGKEGSSALQPTGGSVTFPNAWLADHAAAKPAAIRGRTAIHRGTRTARDGFLRHDRAVPADTAFSAEFVLDKADEASVALLLALLALVDGQNRYSAAGSGSGQGDGRIKWVPDSVAVRRFGSAQMAVWLARAPGTSWKLDAAPAMVAPVDLGTIDHAPRAAFPLRLHVDGHFLVSVAAPKEKQDADPSRVPFRMRKDEKPTAWLPGSSLDGALSAQAERIWRTMAADLTEWMPGRRPACHQLLFGAVDHAGLLDVTTFRSDPARTIEVQIEFVAIDRFTGGSLDGAKFAVRAFEAPVLEGEIGITLRRTANHALTGKPESNAPQPEVSPAAIGLLALTLKDLAEGDIPLGYGTRKGFGRIEALTYKNGGWRELLNALGAAAAGDDGPPDLRGLEPRDALRKAVAALEAEAAAWPKRAATSGAAETQESAA